MKICAFLDCVKPVRTSKLCRGHYNQWQKGQELRPLQELYAGKLCAGPECERVATRRGLCASHYAIHRRGEALRPLMLDYAATRNMSLAERLEHYSGPRTKSGCRLWQGAKSARNYPVVNGSDELGTNLAHRVAYILATGDTPAPHEPIHHKCGQSLCVEAAHLQKVNSWENSAEMLERTHYKRRIADLEAALRELDPHNAALGANDLDRVA